MLERLRNQIGTAGLIVAIVALVAALGGGAYAATGANSGKATASAKQGKQGKQGKPGKTGPAGPVGPAGPAGPKGDVGGAGANGAPGANGKSVTVAEVEPGEPQCEERGGAIVKQEGAGSGAEVCTGEEGSPWTAGGTLPPGETETGTWGVLGPAAGGQEGARVPLSFSVPLASALDSDHVHFINLNLGDPVPTGCLGGTAESPKAAPGNLCVFTGEYISFINEDTGEFEGAEFTISGAGGSQGASTSGAVLQAEATPLFKLLVEARGSWAVTAPEEP